ncbi:hypothetical protein LPJ61_002833 [Coemansia biformis]|uniref:Uncharacterized protein n=1 Tax=Coemansia biformis TaxID=1286918 RepID=A0A9W8CW31_9FUNG|nr:hypothetical protein LPJ61_002833 [Coemansia biformis]
MFSSKKAKGRQNIRRKEAAAGDGAADDGLADVVKRSAKPKAESKPYGISGMALGSGGGSDGGDGGGGGAAVGGARPGRARAALQIPNHTPEHAEGDGGERAYSHADILELKGESARTGAPEADGVVYPFADEGIPDSQQIYMAKKLRRERRAVQAAEEPGNAHDEDFIRLSDDMEDSRLDDAEDTGAGDAGMSDLDDGAAEGEDENDAVIVDKNERAEFSRVSRKAMEESVAQVNESELSDWESAQLRSAGVATVPRAAGQGPLLPEDAGFEFDHEQLRFMIEQEASQLAVEEARLSAARDRLAASTAALEELDRSIEHAQRQHDHFMSLNKATAV